MPDADQRTPFHPQPQDFAGRRMPPTVPAGTRPELSRPRLAPAGVDNSMRPLLAALANPKTRQAFARVVLGTASDAPSPHDERALTQLESAGLIVRSGDDWDVDEAYLRTLLQQGTRRRPKNGPERFFTTDGRIDRYPSQHGERHEFLQALAARVINATETLSEAELGARLAALTDDTALLRRMLVDHGILDREPSGATYRLSAASAINDD